MNIESGFETKKARVEMLPLIDVVFLLLVFFIYAFISMAVHHGIAVDLPKVGQANLQNNDHIAITIDAENQIFVNKTAVEKSELIAEIESLLSADSETPIFINGDNSADLGKAIQILELLQNAGIQKVSFSCEID